MLLAENLLRHREFSLDRYNLPEHDYRLQNVDGHRYYVFPPGSSLLSIPFVAAMHLRGISAVRGDGAYDIKGELALDARLAAILMAVFATLSYLTARFLLPIPSSLVVAGVSAFGTQVFSTASRSMWSDTWGILLIASANLLLLRACVQGERERWLAIATLEASAYVVRPTNSLAIVGTAAYLVFANRALLLRFLAALAGWLSLFMAYSWLHFRRIVPEYFSDGRLRFGSPWQGLLGNLVCPSRGLFVCVPAAVAVAIILLRYRRKTRYRKLIALSLFVIVTHFIVLAGFGHWWGGHSYGARLTTGLVPWLVLLGVIGLDALRAEERDARYPLSDAVLAMGAAVLCAASVIINAIGAFSEEANRWNLVPENIDAAPERLWSWRRPQFLAPFIEPEGPYLVLPATGLRVGSGGAERYLGLGWGRGEGDFRWTDGATGASVLFSLPTVEPGVIEVDLRPYLASGKLREQRLVLLLNGCELGKIALVNEDFASYRFSVPGGVTKSQNLLRLRMPDAVSPATIEGTTDRRQLGVAVRSIRWESGRTDAGSAPAVEATTCVAH